MAATDRNVNIRIGYFSTRAPRRCEKLYVKLVKNRIKTAKSAHKTTNDRNLVRRVCVQTYLKLWYTSLISYAALHGSLPSLTINLHSSNSKVS